MQDDEIDFREDKLPQKICDGCSYKLEVVYDFRNTTVNAEKQLLSWLNESQGAAAEASASTPTKQVVEPEASQVKPTETFVKQEAIDPSDLSKEEDDVKNYVFPDKYDEPLVDNKLPENEDEPPPPKRAKRTAAVKAAIAIDDHESDEDDDDSGEPLTKVEDESDDGSDEDNNFVDMPSTSADDQPGPSGVGKDGGEAPVKIENNDETAKRDGRTRTKRKYNKIIVQPSILDIPLECETCQMKFTNNLDFAYHSKIHSKEGFFSCHICENYKNTAKSLVELHIRAHEGIKKYECEVCHKAFRRIKDAVDHKFTHNGEKPFQCEICGKHFMLSSNLSTHKRNTHYEIITGKPLVKYDCTKCNKHYATHSGLFRHNSMHHKELGQDCSVLCDICGIRIASKHKLKFHMIIHTGNKPYACPNCDKTFGKKDQLKIHERTHTGEKPFECSFCLKRFAQIAPFKYHIKTHTGDRKHVCVICKKTFISRSNMKIHMRTCNFAIKKEK